MRRVSPEEIDALLPQTQCGLCGYGGCMPYAEKIAYENAAINLCPPGGVQTLKALAELLKEDASSFLDEMALKTKPPVIANIREAECIGCTKCIQACPVDAILGSAKQMHTIIAAECTGCELCIPPCPVDCIDLLASIPLNATQKNASRERFNNRNERLEKEKKLKDAKTISISENKKRDYIAEAIARAKSKKG